MVEISLMTTKEYHRNYYHTKVDKKRKLRLQKERRVRIQTVVWNYLLHHPCVDCGETDPVVLDFDHVRGEKFSTIADALRLGWSEKRLFSEIEKCEVRCANCHRRVTAVRNNWFCNIIQPP